MKLHNKNGLTNSLLREIVRILKVAIFLIPNLMGCCYRRFSVEYSGRRLMVIYDLSSQPFSVGDILVMQEAALVLQKNLELKKCDFAILYNPKKPAAGHKTFKTIDIESGLFHLASILPVAQINKNLGSIFSFDSRSQLEKYLRDNKRNLEVWPSNWKLNITREYLYYAMFEELLLPFFYKNGYLPILESRKPLKDWAHKFYEEHSKNKFPVTINIRNNHFIHKQRNSNLDEWFKFFKNNESRYPVKFFLICAHSEVDDRFRALSNVIIVKDFHSTVEQDLSLIECSAIHMGTSSGPATIAWFSHNPYFIANATLHIEHFSNENLLISVTKDTYKFAFAKTCQKFYAGKETAEILDRYLEEALQIVEPVKFRSDDGFDMSTSINWLR